MGGHVRVERPGQREIAERLFATGRTIELHLTNAYGKLGVTSTRELNRALRGWNGYGTAEPGGFGVSR